MKSAQTTLEYLYLIGVVAVALIATLVYISRGFQGNIRMQANQVGEQYAPRHMTTNTTQTWVVNYATTAPEEGSKSKISTSKSTTNMTNVGSERTNSLR